MSERGVEGGVSLEELVGRVADEFTARPQAGERPDVEEYAARYPQVASLLRQALPALAAIDATGAQGPAGGAAEGSPLCSGVLGDFRIVREVGRGGMGVVYEAEQLSLGRRVALKVLPFAATMDPRHLQRFHNEARAAACLHHPNIVPVHFVGSERGVHFYAMQFIEGQSLEAFLRRQRQDPATGGRTRGEPTTNYRGAVSGGLAAETAVETRAQETEPVPRDTASFRRVAGWGIEAAEALEHAHALGVVHRDVKPGNLLLDAQGKLWVTDFGLARVGADTGLTQTGDVLGTLRYMSPEQALAKHDLVDHRSDVYSLGATLYEVLTLEPVFAGTDRQELLRQIAFEEPRAPGKLNQAVPAELEVIVLKALEKGPADRYGTAQELADDLRCFLEDRPIRAKRPTPVQRARKWARRHKAVVAGGVTALVMGLAVLAGSIGWVARDREARRAKTKEVVAAALEESASWQEGGRLPEALSAARRADGLLAGSDVEDVLQQRVRARVADLEFLEKLENFRLEMTAVREGGFDHERADALYGDAFRAFGLDVEALPAEQARERIRGTTVAAELASALDHWAVIRRSLRGADDRSWEHFRRVARAADADAWRTRVRGALERRDRRALRELAASAEVSRLPAVTLFILGCALRDDPEARGQAEAFLREAQRRHPDDFWLNYNLWDFFHAMQPPQLEDAVRFAAVAVALRPGSPGAHLNLGADLHRKGRLEEAIACYREAIRLKKEYAEAHSNLGNALRAKGLPDKAIIAYREAIRLKKDGPDPHNGLGNALRDKGDLDGAIACYREAIRLKKDYAEAHNNLGAALRDKGRLDAAVIACREALRIKKDYPEAHYNLGVVLYAQGRLIEAIACYREAIRLNKNDPLAHHNLGLALADRGRLDEATGEYREAIRLKQGFAKAHLSLGNALHATGRLDEAIAEFREALKKQFPEAYKAHNNLGTALAQKGRLDEAIAEFRQAIRLKNDFARAYCNLGHALRDQGRFANALAELKCGHELGSRNRHWPYPSAEWVRDCERFIALDARLPAILGGQKQPADTAERLGLARLCQMGCKKRYLAATRFYSEAFAEEPKLADDLNAQHRYDAARAAALAGCGQGKDADNLDARERARLRRQALDWLRADLKAYRQVMEKSAGKAGPAIAQRMQRWLADDDFAGVRGADALAKLPGAERKEWRQLWDEVEALRRNAAGRPGAASPARP